QMGQALLAGLTELYSRLDILAGRQIVYVSEVRQVQGQWLIERCELVGEAARRLESLLLSRGESPPLPHGERADLTREGPDARGMDLVALHPLLVYDAEANECAFLNARRGRTKTEYLCYTTGQTFTCPDLGEEQRELLARALGLESVTALQI